MPFVVGVLTLLTQFHSDYVSAFLRLMVRNGRCTLTATTNEDHQRQPRSRIQPGVFV